MFRTLLGIALRNLVASKVKTVVVGGILTFGTVLVLLGASLLTTLDISMAESLVGSIAGHMQISSAKGKDKLVLFPSPIDGTDIGQLENFPELRKRIEALPEVRAVVPMGLDVAFVFGGNLLDVKLNELVKAQEDKTERYEPVRDHIRRIVELLSSDLKNLEALTDKEKGDKEILEGIAQVRKAAKPEFWADFDAKFAERLEFLENKVARMAFGEDMIPLRYMGTDTERFAQEFSRFEIVDGTAIPKGQRGFLFAKFYYEEMVKHKTARRMDRIKERLAEGFGFNDSKIAEWRRQNISQYKEITYQLDKPAEASVRQALQSELASKATDIIVLVKDFLDVDASNFAVRHKLFYDIIAPHLNLYRIPLGSTMTIRGFSKSGYSTSVNVKVYGTFRFRSLEKSMLAGAVNIMDVMSFRDLYGMMTADRQAELDQMKEGSGIEVVAREDAEEALFGEEDVGDEAGAEGMGRQAPAAVTATRFDEFAGVDMSAGAELYRAGLADQVYDQAAIDGGVVRNAAVILHDRADIAAVTARITAMSDADGLDLSIMDWRTASGMIGQFMGVIYMVLIVAIGGIFGVALFIINNSTVMATIERTREIGTMRAIGAQRRTVLTMFLLESMVLGAIFGVVGAVIGAIIIAITNSIGIPAFNDTLVFLFAGPRLHPILEIWHVVAAISLVLLVTGLSTIHPAWLATRVSPVVAMGEGDS